MLVPFQGIKTHTSFMDEGITYDKLSDEAKETLEEDFENVGLETPDSISKEELNRWVFNEKTVDSVLVTLMEKGIRVNGGEDLGKTVIFAQNQKHARFIAERFGKLYPNLPGDYIKTVLNSDDYSHSIIDEFELKPRPIITVSVDMMDTGIDVPEIVNLVFFKKIRSKIKFWQMIGRGTRLCEGLNVDDPLSGRHKNKERFFIFDWCRNFEFFEQDPKETEGRVGKSLSETVFIREATLVKDLQQAAFAGDDYQKWRSEMVEELWGQVCQLSDEMVSVRLHRKAVERFKQKSSFDVLNAGDLAMLISEVAPLVHNDEPDVNALRFDALMYGFMCAVAEGAKSAPFSKRVTSVAVALEERTTIPQVKEQLPLLQQVTSEGYLADASPLDLEEVRKGLRGLVRFLVNGPRLPDVVTHLDDPLTCIEYDSSVVPGEDFADYRLKVERYLQDHADALVIHKLRHNQAMTAEEFGELERIFTHDLGTASDYQMTYGDEPFGLQVRKLAKLDRQAANEAFADFINSQSLNEQQISFVRRVIDYVVENGYMEPGALIRPPFDRPRPFARMFDTKQQMGLVAVINGIKHNAEEPAA